MKQTQIKNKPSGIKKINYLEKIRKNPYSMLTLNMGGKMENMNSLSTSCTNNENCQKRIAKAIEKIRNFSKEAAEIIDRYLLPSEDKKHLTGKKTVEMLEKLGCKVCICIFCYANKTQQYQDSARNKFQGNGEYLKELQFEENLPVCIPSFIDGLLPFRFEAEGDLHNTNHGRNFIRTCNKPENSKVNFALWTKNPGLIWDSVIAEGGKPSNLQLVLSSVYVNQPDLKVFEYYNNLCKETFGYNLFDKLFTVWTEKGIQGSGFEFNCCGSEGNKNRKCKDCLNCYKSSGYNTFVNELLR